MVKKQNEELHQYTHFLENRIDSLEDRFESVQQLLALLFDVDEEAEFSIRFCTCDDDSEEDSDGDESDGDEEDDDWY